MNTRLHHLAEAHNARFGTSGVRGLVSDLSDAVCYAYAQAFLRSIATDSARVVVGQRCPEGDQAAGVDGDLGGEPAQGGGRTPDVGERAAGVELDPAQATDRTDAGDDLVPLLLEGGALGGAEVGVGLYELTEAIKAGTAIQLLPRLVEGRRIRGGEEGVETVLCGLHYGIGLERAGWCGGGGCRGAATALGLIVRGWHPYVAYGAWV